MELVGALCGHCARRTQRSLQKKKTVIKMSNQLVTGTKKWWKLIVMAKNRCGSRKFRKE